jgi:hypothetical protein
MAWLVAATGESAGQCRVTLMLAERIQHMLSVKAAFAAGDLSESALRQLTDTWCEQIADAFGRDEALLLRWAQRLSYDDLRITLATWRAHVDPDQRRADALVTLARFYLTNARPTDTTSPSTQPAMQPARSPGKRRRPKVIAAIAWNDLLAGEGVGTIDTGSGRIVVSPDTIRRLACDAGFHRLVYAADGTVLDFGRQTRTISDSLFEVLAARDHGCRIKDCPVPSGGCDAHHADHWADHGATEPDNLPLLCWFHHHLVHDQHWSIEPLGGGHFILIDPDGGEHEMRPPMLAGALPQLTPAA